MSDHTKWSETVPQILYGLTLTRISCRSSRPIRVSPLAYLRGARSRPGTHCSYSYAARPTTRSTPRSISSGSSEPCGTSTPSELPATLTVG